MSQLEDLEKLYKEYAADSRFDSLKQEGVHLVPGKGPLNPKIMLIGESPGFMENSNRLPFIGRAGQNLSALLTDIDIDPFHVFMTNVVKYWPKPKIPGEKRYITTEETKASRDYIKEEIEIVDPDIVGLMGRFAIQAIYPEKTQVFESHGQLLDDMYVPLYHPAVLSYTKEKRGLIESGFMALKRYAYNE